MISLFVSLARFILLAAFTFLFIVLFEHGPRNFFEGIKGEWTILCDTVRGRSVAESSRDKDSKS